jgi:hypothetical protein
MSGGFGLVVLMVTLCNSRKNPSPVISSGSSASIGVHRRFKIAAPGIRDAFRQQGK